MKKFLIPAIILLTAPVVLLSSCKKDDDDDHDHHHDEVSITIMSPDASMRMNGDTVHIHVDFNSEGTIHNVKVQILNTSDSNNELFVFEEHVHEEDGDYSYQGDYILSGIPAMSDLKLIAKSWPHGEDETEATEESVTFHVHM